MRTSSIGNQHCDLECNVRNCFYDAGDCSDVGDNDRGILIESKASQFLMLVVVMTCVVLDTILNAEHLCVYSIDYHANVESFSPSRRYGAPERREDSFFAAPSLGADVVGSGNALEEFDAVASLVNVDGLWLKLKRPPKGEPEGMRTRLGLLATAVHRAFCPGPSPPCPGPYSLTRMLWL